MTWSCSKCDADSVVSRQEWVEVFDWRHHVRSRTRHIAENLTSRGLSPQPTDDAETYVRRWAVGATNGGPDYICTDCLTPQSGKEVPA